MRERGCSLTIQWTPAHKGVEGNEIADTYAKCAAGGYLDTDKLDKTYLREASLAHLTRKAAEAKTRSTKDWTQRHIKAERRYRPPKGGKIRKDPQRENKSAASRFFQLLSSHAAIGPHLAEVTKAIRSDKCWWCNSGERQSRHHLFIKCRAWKPRLRSCGRASGRHASGSTRGRQPPDCSSEMRERLRPFSNPCGTLRLEVWLL